MRAHALRVIPIGWANMRPALSPASSAPHTARPHQFGGLNEPRRDAAAGGTDDLYDTFGEVSAHTHPP